MIRIAVAFCILLMGVASARVVAQPRADAPIASTLQEFEKRLVSVEQSVRSRPKDVWDKVAAISGLASALLVALIGFYATNIYSRRQKEREEARKDQDLKMREDQARHAEITKEKELSLQQAQILEKFMPHLASSDERMKEAALLMISLQVSEKVAAELAVKFRGEGSGAALTKIAAASKDPESFRTAFGELFAALRLSLVVVEVGGNYTANGFFIDDRGTVATPAHVVNQNRHKIQVRTAGNALLEPDDIVVDKARDLALLKIPAASGSTPVSLSTTLVEPGSQVVSLWQSPNGLLGEVGTVLSTDVSQSVSETGDIAISLAHAGPGISGAPVVDSSGRLVGMVHAGTGKPLITYLIPAKEIALLASRGHAARKARSGRRGPRTTSEADADL